MRKRSLSKLVSPPGRTWPATLALLGVLLHPLAAWSGMVAYWPFDTSYQDASGNGHDGTPVNSPFLAPGKIGYSVSFDGNLAQYVQVADHPQLDFGTGDFSVVFWARPDQNVGSGHGMIAKDSFGLEPTYAGWLLNEADALGGLGLQTRRLGVADTSARTPTRIPPGTWGHLAAVRGNGQLRLYRDAIPTGSWSFESSATDVSNGAPLTIGSLYPTPSPQHFSGDLDEIAIFDHALTVPEIGSIFLYGVPTVDSLILFAGDLDIDLRIRTDNGAFEHVLLAGSDFYNAGSRSADWGLLAGTDFSSFVANTAMGAIGQPVVVERLGVLSARVTGTYTGGGLDVSFARTITLDDRVIHIEVELVNNDASQADVTYFEGFDSDQGVAQGAGYNTFSDRYVAAGGTQVALASSSSDGTAGGNPDLTVVLATDDPQGFVSAGAPQIVQDGAMLDAVVSSPPDANGAFADTGIHAGIRVALPPAGSHTFVYDHAYGPTPADALAELGLPPGPPRVPALGGWGALLLGATLLGCARRAQAAGST